MHSITTVEGDEDLILMIPIEKEIDNPRRIEKSIKNIFDLIKYSAKEEQKSRFKL